MGMGGHQSARMLKDEWLTPPEILESLGPFDLDPCSPINRPWDTAKKHLTVRDNGLKSEWKGRVWLNPPYGRETAEWLHKLSDHGNGIALIFARTETEMFFDHVWNKADALLFFKGRLYFHHVNGNRAKANAGAPSVLIAYGPNNVQALENVNHLGMFVKLK
ncbi:adenine methyltransferase [Paenibacillus glucanolyticus]|nr:adenine methyltransferase [Paenibacillus glucanolyticus]